MCSSDLVSYLLILPLAILGGLFWYWMGSMGEFRLVLTVTVVPIVGFAIIMLLFVNTSSRLLHPPDVGSEGQEVVDLEQEAQEAVGLVIQRDQFPDKLFAPAKRDDFMDDHANPVYDKEIRSEIFSQGTLMLRLVIQISMLLAIPLMAALCFTVAVTALVRPYFDHSSLSDAPSPLKVLAHIFLLQDVLYVEAFSAGVWYVAIDFQLFVMALLCATLAHRWQAVTQQGSVIRKAWGMWMAMTLISMFVWNLNPLGEV